MQRLTAVFIVLAVLLGSTAQAVTNKRIGQKKSELASISGRLNTLNAELENSVSEYEKAYEEAEQIQARNDKTKREMRRLAEELDYYQSVLNDRARSIYINGNPSFIDFIFSCSSFNELVSYVDLHANIIKSDNEVIEGVRVKRSALRSTKLRLDAQLAEAEVKIDNLSAQKEAVQTLIAQKNALLDKVKSQIAELQRQEKARILAIRRRALRTIKPAAVSIAGNNAKSVEIAKQFLGVRYTWGGESPETGFDCSGLTYYVYAQLSIYLPRTSRNQYSYLCDKGRQVIESNLVPGDLVFYGKDGVSHVVIYMGGGYIIGASGGQFIAGEVKILPLHYRSDYIGAARP